MSELNRDLPAVLERVAGEETGLLREILSELVLIRRTLERQQPHSGVHSPDTRRGRSGGGQEAGRG